MLTLSYLHEFIMKRRTSRQHLPVADQNVWVGALIVKPWMVCWCFRIEGLLLSSLCPTLNVCMGWKVCQITSSSCFSVVSRTLTGIIDNYFGGYYTEKMMEAQVGLCLQYPSPVWRWLEIYFVAFASTSSLKQWSNALPIFMSQFRNDGQGIFCSLHLWKFPACWGVIPLSCALKIGSLLAGGPASFWAVGVWTFPKIMWVLSCTEEIWCVLW